MWVNLNLILVLRSRLYDSHVRLIEITAALVEDERQLDGSRHVEIVGDTADADAALRLVVDRDGAVEEAELSLDIHGDSDGMYAVIGFDQDARVATQDRLDIHLRGADGELVLRQRDDGDIDMSLTLFAALGDES